MNTVLDKPVPDYAAIKQRQQATWASGDYAAIGTTLQIVGETLAEAADVRAGERVLDVAAGNGNASLAAARRHAQVTSTDYVQALLAKGHDRAVAEGLNIRFQHA
ncbi:MAG: class I SAM-dependent methyltransferase, partial [Hydrogenophaga sp.]|nr:class I SAM-dependent methyltransferase [Hydrogenophaga sp.]